MTRSLIWTLASTLLIFSVLVFGEQSSPYGSEGSQTTVSGSVNRPTFPYPWHPSDDIHERNNYILDLLRGEIPNGALQKFAGSHGPSRTEHVGPILYVEEELLPSALKLTSNHSNENSKQMYLRNADGYSFSVDVFETFDINGSKLRSAGSKNKASTKAGKDPAASKRDLSKESDVLRNIDGSCMSFPDNYWNYEICHREEIRQFHLEGSPQGNIRTTDWSLGTYDRTVIARSDSDPSNTESPIKKIVDYYVDGQYCDETKTGRSTEVHFQCCKNMNLDKIPKRSILSRLPSTVEPEKVVSENPEESRPKRSNTRTLSRRKKQEVAETASTKEDKALDFRFDIRTIAENEICHYQMIVCNDFMCDDESSKKSATSKSSDGNRDASKDLPSKSSSSEKESNNAKESQFSSILMPLAATCLYLQEDWWTYEYCLHKGLRQFHLEPVTKKQGDVFTQTQVVQVEYSLGLINASIFENNTALFQSTSYYQDNIHAKDPSSTKSPNSRGRMAFGMPIKTVLTNDPNGKRNTLVLTYGNGTTCDLSKEPRQSEVILGCGERDHLVDVTETRTCHYQVKVLLTSLCQFEGFAKKTKKYATLLLTPDASWADEDDEYTQDEIKEKKPETE